MVLDTSAVVAILQGEEEAGRLVAALEADSVRHLSAASLLEGSIVLQARYGDHGEREMDLFVQRAHVSVMDVTPEDTEVARAAFRRFGKGRDRAGLNFGDCFSYALSITTGEPLLFVGDDFGQTDVEVVAY